MFDAMYQNTHMINWLKFLNNLSHLSYVCCLKSSRILHNLLFSVKSLL